MHLRSEHPSILPAAILFDMDGTLTRPFLDFDKIKAEMGIGNRPILETLAILDAARRELAEAVLHRHERHAAEQSTLNEGCEELLTWLKSAGIETARVTRNTRQSVRTVFDRHGLHFDICVTREDGKFKPDPAPLLLACQRLKVSPAQTWMVGDGSYDVQAGIAADIRTVWISHGEEKPFAETPWKTVRESAGVADDAATLQRRIMNRLTLILLACLATQCTAQPTPPLSPPAAGDSALPAEASVDQTLDAPQSRGQNLNEFTADVKLTETDTTFGTSTVRSGKVWYQLKPDGNARLRVLFEKKSVEDKPAQPDRKEYLLDDGRLIDRDYRIKNETTRQIARPGEKVNLFQLGKGPFPLPIGQDKKDVLNLFDVTKPVADKDDPADTIHLQFKPKPDTDFARKFSTIDVWVDLKTQMPARIETLDKKQAADRKTDLENLKVNPKPPLTGDDFKLSSIEEGWNRHEESFDQYEKPAMLSPVFNSIKERPGITSPALQ